MAACPSCGGEENDPQIVGSTVRTGAESDREEEAVYCTDAHHNV